MEPVEADGGISALRAVDSRAPGERGFGLVLLDSNMPGMDGFMFVEQLRKRQDLNQSTIMMLTSGGRDGDIERCQSLGIASHLTKPVKEADLLSEVTRVLSESRPKPEENPSIASLSQAIEANRQPRAHILLAEDNLVNQKYAKTLLTRWGHDVTIAQNGFEAVKATSQTRFDLVFMDLQMPEMDGYGATAEIRKNAAYAGVPIIAMTARAMEGDRDECLRLGMNDYVSKPVRPQTLADALARWLPNYPSAGQDITVVTAAASRRVD